VRRAAIARPLPVFLFQAVSGLPLVPGDQEQRGPPLDLRVRRQPVPGGGVHGGQTEPDHELPAVGLARSVPREANRHTAISPRAGGASRRTITVTGIPATRLGSLRSPPGRPSKSFSQSATLTPVSVSTARVTAWSAVATKSPSSA